MTNHFRIVLIETLWNVNINNWIDYCFCFHVLIETLWNVNILYPIWFKRTFMY